MLEGIYYCNESMWSPYNDEDIIIYALENEISIKTTVTDDNSFVELEQFQFALEINALQYEVIIVKDINELGDCPYEIVNRIQDLKEVGVKVIALNKTNYEI